MFSLTVLRTAAANTAPAVTTVTLTAVPTAAKTLAKGPRLLGGSAQPSSTLHLEIELMF
jgi:hypothetical protein